MTSYWWYYVLSRSLAATYGPGVTHVHSIGAVCIGEGAKGDFFGTVPPEIAGLSINRAAESMRLLPFGTISTDQNKTHNIGAVLIGNGGHTFNLGAAAPYFPLPYSSELGAVCPEIAGLSSNMSAEPMRLLPFASLSTGQSKATNFGAVMIGEGAKIVFSGAICPEIAGLSSKQSGEPMRYLPFGSVTTGEGGG